MHIPDVSKFLSVYCLHDRGDDQESITSVSQLEMRKVDRGYKNHEARSGKCNSMQNETNTYIDVEK